MNDTAPPTTGSLRLFAVNKTDAEARAILDAGPHEVTHLLGVQDLNTDYIEMFRIADLGDLGLDDYLHTGYDVPRAQLDADATRLRALSGHALVVLPLAFGDGDMTLDPTPDLTLIGTYGAPTPDWTSSGPIPSRAATEGRPMPKTPSEAAILGRVATVALLVIFALTALVIWLA